MITDFYGNVHNDDLAEFAREFLNTPVLNLMCFEKEGQHLIDGASGITLMRSGQYQVQLFLISPNKEIPEHEHPNVDSFEILLRGMKFTLNGRLALSMKRAQMTNDNGSPKYQGQMLRVYNGSPHGGLASSDGGAFISIQKWLNGISPTTVSDDWHGDIMGHIHEKRLMKWKK